MKERNPRRGAAAGHQGEFVRRAHVSGRDPLPRRDRAESSRKDEEGHGLQIIAGRNAVNEALRSGRTIDVLYIARDALRAGTDAQDSPSAKGLRALAAKARAAGAVIKEADNRKLDGLCGGAVHQGVVASAAVKEYVTVDEILNLAQQRGEAPFIIIADELEDPHNLGAHSPHRRMRRRARSHYSQAPFRRADLRGWQGLRWCGGVHARGPCR